MTTMTTIHHNDSAKHGRCIDKSSRSTRGRKSKTTAVLAVVLAAQLVALQTASADWWRNRGRHDRVAQRVAGMVSDHHANRLADRHGLDIVNLPWEDTGRYQGSSVGPNISDVTIEVEARGRHGQTRTYLMPVMRYPNFTDKTGDVDIDKFYIRVGNHEGDRLETITLRELLRRPYRYMSFPRDGRIAGGTLLSDRDDKVLTSAQAAFLPVPHRANAKFHPVIFNYQSSKNNPAVLTILATRQGTSMTIIDNNRDTVGPRSWGQRLYFNDNGERAPLIAERLKDVRRRGYSANGESSADIDKNANLMMIIQVPLVIKRRHRPVMPSPDFNIGAAEAAPGAPMAKSRREDSDIDVAVIGHGPSEGRYTELDGLTIRRDQRFPIRATVQFYQATSNGVVHQADVRRLARQINRVYDSADYVGSLVVPETPTRRPTEWYGSREREPRFGLAF